MSCVLNGIVPLGLVLLVCGAQGFFLPNVTHLEKLLSRCQQDRPHSRVRRAIPRVDKEDILMLHNRLRGQVSPPASNMEHLVSAGAPRGLAPSVGGGVGDGRLGDSCPGPGPSPSSGLSAAAFRVACAPTSATLTVGHLPACLYRSPGFHVQSWYDEVKDYTYPYPHECNPWCPERCSGAMCTHYTQIVWATTTKIGCAVNTCQRMNVWGDVWENAVYLVCNYSPKGNWIGEAPYRTGRPCSECPPRYGGSCRNNLCYREETDDQKPETDEMNEVEMAPIPEEKHIWVPPSVIRPTKPKKAPTVNYMTQVVRCDTKMKDKCKGSTCNRYQCPAGCLHHRAKIFGTLFYESASSICRAAIHYGVLDDKGGLVDVTRNGKVPFFVKSERNGVQSLSKYKASSSFTVSKVKVQDLDCYTTVAQLCPYEKPGTHCPRVHCPAHCKDEPSYWAPVLGTNIYADTSSICKTAVHAGVIRNKSGGYVDVMPVDKKKIYVGSLRNGVQSESLRTPRDGKAFRIFAVRPLVLYTAVLVYFEFSRNSRDNLQPSLVCLFLRFLEVLLSSQDATILGPKLLGRNLQHTNDVLAAEEGAGPSCRIRLRRSKGLQECSADPQCQLFPNGKRAVALGDPEGHPSGSKHGQAVPAGGAHGPLQAVERLETAPGQAGVQPTLLCLPKSSGILKEEAEYERTVVVESERIEGSSVSGGQELWYRWTEAAKVTGKNEWSVSSAAAWVTARNPWAPQGPVSIPVLTLACRRLASSPAPCHLGPGHQGVATIGDVST
ncbi:PREDICTED: cysteine-rich secretory protein LCCL domain-containing 2 [Lipotes vexillifer]|uniref:Cysteine-rich secretory protein LCCL domain-containing 2 n=1 Tax=Lipotes vexillifer TaxID=118797 RepID=A0A340YAU7_LIPVE|nr:PREDICTED: cysteine-rich secretory protein LCCL domain-containing 2 [Lipotes vexillifer]